MAEKPVQPRALSLVSRLTRLNLLILAGTICLTVTILAAVTWQSARARHLAVAVANTEQLALNLASSLVFQDKAAAEHEISAYARRPDVQSVAVFDAGSQLFIPDQVPVLWQNSPAYALQGLQQMQIKRPVRLKNEIVGAVVVTESLHSLQQSLLSMFALFIGIMLLALLLASRLLRWVQRRALAPVLELAELAEFAAKHQDYSIRANIRRRDEVGRLGERLNELFKRTEIWQQDLQQQLQAQKQTSQQLDKLAHYDHLTGLANRLYFEAELPRAVEHTLQSGQRMALLFVDLDNFKTVNDQWGHDAGDEVLQIVAKRMLSQLRQSDLVFRLGGDEFAVLLSDIGQPLQAELLAERLIQSVREPMWVKAALMPVGATIGLALCPDHSSDAHQLLQQADEAMYQAKRAGKNTFRRYCDAY